MRKQILFVLFSLATLSIHADEGMWMPSQLPQLAKPLRDAGFKGDPKTLADVTAAPLSAVRIFWQKPV